MTWIGVSAVLLIVAAIGTGLLAARGIARPIERLASQSRRIAEGDISVRAGEGGPRETDILARSFNRMIDCLATERASLERRVQERVAELERKDGELQRATRLASVGLIAGAVAHDLNSPLTSVVLNTEALLEVTPSTDGRRRVLEDLLREGRRCRAIAVQLRSLCRQDGGIEGVPCSIRSVVDEAVRLTRFKWEPKGASIVVEPFPDSVLRGAPQLLRALTLLVSSAFDASKQAGEVRIRVRPGGDAVVVEVEAGGAHVPPVARWIVEAQGGTVESDAGVIRLALPMNGRTCGTPG